jgi:DNA-binding NarL/FixJ family response regulator
LDWVICGEAKTGLDAVRLANKLKPDVVIIELQIPELDGIETIRQIRQNLAAAEILVYTTHEEVNLFSEALRAGARGYVLKSDSEAILIEAVDSLGAHAPYFSTRSAEMLAGRLLKTDAESDSIDLLTSRERQIVAMLAEESSNKQIASFLQLSIKTVEAHRATIMHKLGFRSITELVRYAIRNSLIRP